MIITDDNTTKHENTTRSDGDAPPNYALFGEILASYMSTTSRALYLWNENSCHIDAWLVMELVALGNPFGGRCADIGNLVKHSKGLKQLLRVLVAAGTDAQDELRDTLHRMHAEHSYGAPYGHVDDAMIHIRILHIQDRHVQAHRDDRVVQFGVTYTCTKCGRTKKKSELSPMLYLDADYVPWDDQQKVHGPNGDSYITDAERTAPIRIKTIAESVDRSLNQPCMSQCKLCVTNTYRRTVNTPSVCLPRLLILNKIPGVGRHNFVWTPQLNVGKIPYMLVGVLAKSSNHWLTVFLKDNTWYVYNDLSPAPTRAKRNLIGTPVVPSGFQAIVWYYVTGLEKANRKYTPQASYATDRYHVFNELS